MSYSSSDEDEVDYGAASSSSFSSGAASSSSTTTSITSTTSTKTKQKSKRPPSTAEATHTKEVKARTVKYNRDPINDREAAKKKGKNRGGVARREQREERAQQRRMPKSEDPKLQATLRRQEMQYQDAEDKAARAELLLPEETGVLEAEGDMEKTYKFKQIEIRKGALGGHRVVLGGPWESLGAPWERFGRRETSNKI